MEVLDNQSPQEIESNDEGGAAAPPPAPAVEPAPKTQLEILKEKAAGGVAPSVKTPEQIAAEAAAIPPAFKPNFKFKAAGKELDVPEMFKGLMKDAESEKYLHQMLSKAHGIEMIQEKLKSTRTDRDQAVQAYQTMRGTIDLGQEAYKRGDMDMVFDTLKIDPNKVLQWAYRKVELSQMPADQRQVHEQHQAEKRRNFEMERQFQAQQQQGSDTQAQQINQMLDMVMERQDVNAIAQAYDTRKQKEGSFRDLVVMMGEQAFNQGKLITPMDAAKQAVELLGEKWGAPAQAAAPAATQPVNTPAAAPEKKIVLPNAGGAKSAAPAKGKVKTIDDIRKLHQKMASQ